ncbi:hypothetical protein GCM10022381_13280 [Leifsonia kafniensis]|uniref:Uncharacterized protein n=1 Tax=Leifsonia kafniensis TaxID=475957 RepID=A0ABP7KAV9_9MICO
MPRDFVITSPRPVDLADQLLGVAENSLDWEIRTIWGNGAVQVVGSDGQAVLTVLRSIVVEAGSGVDRLLPVTPTALHSYWTEAYGPTDSLVGVQVAHNIAKAVGGELFVNGVPA